MQRDRNTQLQFALPAIIEARTHPVLTYDSQAPMGLIGEVRLDAHGVPIVNFDP